MSRGPLIAAVVTLVAVAGVGIGMKAWTDDGDYSAENAEIIQNLPVYPGSTWVAFSTREYQTGLLGLATGYVSEQTRTLGKRTVTNERLADFYASRLSQGWKRVNLDGCDAFARGDAILLIRRDVFDHSTINIVVDAKGRERCLDYAENLST